MVSEYNYEGKLIMYTLNKNSQVSSQDFFMKIKQELVDNENRVYKISFTSSLVNQTLLMSSLEPANGIAFNPLLDMIQGLQGNLLYSLKNDDSIVNRNRDIIDNFDYNNLIVQISGLFRGNNITVKGKVDKVYLQ